jgi:hypothetical protein
MASAGAVPGAGTGSNNSVGDSISSSTSIRFVSVDAETGLIPYYILDHYNADDAGKFYSKALFLVPSRLVSRLTVHPILCRGSVFCLRLDNHVNQSQSSIAAVERPYEMSDVYNDRNSNASPATTSSTSSATTPAHHGEVVAEQQTAFLSIEYESPYPEAVALEIAKRLTRRVFEETTSGSSSTSAHDAAAMILGL